MSLTKTIAAPMLCIALAASAQPVQTVKIATLDMLSGPMAGLGQNVLKSFQYAARVANEEKWAGPYQFEIVPFDNKLSPQEAVALLGTVVAKDIRYVVQGASSSSVGIALGEAIDKHNARNPGKEIVFLNYASQAPVLTNEKCSYWHFRTDAHSDMKVDALTTYLAGRKDIRKIHLLNPNYAYGQDTARASRESLARKRADIEIVGDDLHPTAQVKDFAPYMAKIRQSGADAVITASSGSDLALIVRAANDFGLKVDFYTFNGSNYGVPGTIGATGEGRVKLVSTFNPNDPGAKSSVVLGNFKKQFGEDFINGMGYNAVVALSGAIHSAKSAEPAKVAAQLEGLRFEGINGPVVLRKSDHQAQQAMFVQSWEKVDGSAVRYDQEGTGFGWKQIASVDAKAAEQPTTCRMKRPL
ncbi:branched-chain amino acid transport system substrate-binding protein [Variovorax boronicumulans]|nr:branched-chain amino acid ABC transporter substrate-binding protein [Variovorax boronicumulans]MDP9917241.1 branched-chain amino acid transport system substrate-binding protein [Variovorax boronicumulans]